MNAKIKKMSKTYKIDDLITLQFLKKYLHIEAPDDDETLESIIHSVIEFAENYTRNDICAKNIVAVVDCNKTKNVDFSKNDGFNIVFKADIKTLNRVLLNGVEQQIEDFAIEGQKIIFPEVSGMLTFDFDTEQNPLNSSISHALVEHISFVYNNKEGSQSIPQSISKVYDMFREIRI